MSELLKLLVHINGLVLTEHTHVEIFASGSEADTIIVQKVNDDGDVEAGWKLHVRPA